MIMTELKEEMIQGVDDLARWRMPAEENESANADDLRLLALEIIMHDPELAKRLVRAGVRKMLAESGPASG